MRKIMLFAAAVLMAAGPARAGWWIFEKSASAAKLEYLYINGLPAGELGADIILFRETLPPDGTVRLVGRAAAAKGPVGRLRLTLDNGAAWQEVKSGPDGFFEYSFKPEAGKTYPLLIEITDAAGKTGDADETRKVIECSAGHIQAKIRTALDALFDAYNRKNLQKFMAAAGDKFAGGRPLLESAVLRDFDALAGIILRYGINTAAAGAQGRVFVSITYSRTVFVKKTGALNTDSGSTEFVFEDSGGKLLLYSMKQPLLFGISAAGGLSAGLVPGGSGTTLVLDEAGNLVSSAAYAGAYPGTVPPDAPRE